MVKIAVRKKLEDFRKVDGGDLVLIDEKPYMMVLVSDGGQTVYKLVCLADGNRWNDFNYKGFTEQQLIDHLLGNTSAETAKYIGKDYGLEIIL